MAERKYVLSYRREPYWEWDGIALLASQQWNYGNSGNWFYCFRGGLNGFHARMAGAEHHYAAMHAWLPHPRSPKETEYHLAAFFFHVDSAFECLIFALNALGYAASRGNEFRNIGDASALRCIGPNDLLGDSRKGSKPLTGYNQFYPKTVALCQVARPLLDRIFEQHNASKHRHMIYLGGDMRTDAPPGFWKSLNISEGNRNEFLPVHDIILDDAILLPLNNRKLQSLNEFLYFEDVADDFFSLITKTGAAIIGDARIKLKNLTTEPNQ